MTWPADFEVWAASRPEAVREKIFAYPPGKYRMRSTGQFVWLYSYDETPDGRCETCKVNIYVADNPQKITMCLTGDRRVFGVSFEDLEPIDVLSRES